MGRSGHLDAWGCGMAKDRERAAGTNAGLQVVMFLVTAPVAGWLAGAAWQIFSTWAPGVEDNGLALGAATGGVLFAIVPVLWAAMLASAWRDLGRDRRWIVRNSPLALAGVFILTVVAAATA